jgi:AcrR family transcriptional regulator
MEMTRRTQADRTAATRAALVDAARRLFAEGGFAGVGTEAIVAAAGVSRGALYHHFADKTELFAAVFEAVEQEVSERIATAAIDGGSTEFVPLMTNAVNAWFDFCEAPDARRIILEDGPSVLGWTRWRELAQPYALALVEGLVVQAIHDGAVVSLPTRPLAHALFAVAEEAAMYIVHADDPVLARHEMTEVLQRVLESLAAKPH